MNNKKLLAATLISTALFAGSAANAEDVSNWEDLKTGLQSGSTMTMTGNISVPESLGVTSKDNTLYMNGHTLSGGEGANNGLSIFGGSLNLKNSAGQSSVISGIDRSSSTAGVFNIQGGSFTLEGGDFTFQNNKSTRGVVQVWESANPSSSTISSNVNSLIFNNNTSTMGGAIYHEQRYSDSSVVSALNGASIQFTNNSATKGNGGAILNVVGNISILGDTNVFTGNSATNDTTEPATKHYKRGGGAIANASGESLHDATMIIGKSTSTNTFTSNTANTNGGAIMNRAVDEDKNATLTINGNTTFSNNTATENGGAIYNAQQAGRTATVNLNNGTYTFTGNSAGEYGGAIYNQGTMTITNATFGGDTEESGNISTKDGGAIYNAGTLTLNNATFSGNRAGYGGAIENIGVGAALTINGGSFENNVATLGSGAIDNDGNGSVSINAGTTFSGNSATRNGGAIGHWSGELNIVGTEANKVVFSSNHADYNGGAIRSDAVSEISYTIFDRNTADINGGAVHSSKDITISNTAFNNNKAIEDAGGLYTSGNATITNTTFTGNIADDWGGAIANGGTLSVSDSIFEANKAVSGGGAILDFLDSTGGISVTGSIKDTVFINNSAEEQGGAVALFTRNATSKFENVQFISNKTTSGSSTEGSGAIFIGSEAKADIVNTVFDSNTSAADAGAIGMRSFKLGANSAAALDIDKSTFKNNSAVTNGGAINNYLYNDANNDGYVKITSSEFTGNSAANGGAIYNHIGKIGDKLINPNSVSAEDVQKADTDPSRIQVGKMYIADTNFTDNTASSKGGAIYNAGTITFAGTNTFSGNTANNVANDIYNTGTINFAGSGTSTLEGGIDGSAGIVNITDGYVSIANALKNQTTSLNAGTLNILKGTTVDSSHINVANGATLVAIGEDSNFATFQNGTAASGGAINNLGTVDLSYAYFKDNKSTSYGGAINNEGGATLKVDHSIFDNNIVQSDIPGAMTYGGAIRNYGTVAITNSEFTNNKALKPENASGSGVKAYSSALFNAGTATIENSIFDGNRGDYMGGVIQNAGGNLTIKNSIINNSNWIDENTHTSASVLLANSGTTNLSDLTVSGNAAGGEGVIDFQGAANVTFSGTNEFLNNEATAIYNWNNSNTTFKAGSTSIFSGNNATDATTKGGAIYNNATLTFENNSESMFTENTAVYGGAIYNKGTITLADSQFSKNTATDKGGAIYNAGTLTINSENKNIEFSDNMVGSTENDIYNVGTLNFEVSKDRIITLNGGIDGETNGTSTGIVNIHGTGAGVVEADSITNQTVNVTTNASTAVEFVLMNGTETGSNLAGSTVTIGDGAIINTIDDKINNYAGKVILGDGAVVKAEANLGATSSVDKFTAASGANVSIKNITIINDFESGGQYADLLIADGATSVVADNVKAYTTGGAYSVEGSDVAGAGSIRITKTGNGGLNIAVKETSETVPETITYNLTAGEKYYSVADTDDTTVEKANFTIVGNDNKITADNGTTTTQGIIVATDSVVKIQEATLAEFAHEDGAIYNKGILDLDQVTIGSDNTLGLKNEGASGDLAVATFATRTHVDSVKNNQYGIVNLTSGASVNKIANEGTFNIEAVEDLTTAITDAVGAPATGITNVTVAAGDSVNWTTTGITQAALNFSGAGHLELTGGPVVANITNSMTGNTLVISNAVTGTLENSPATAHAELATGASISGLITNDGILDITAANYNITNGIAQTAVTDGTLNIGDGANSANVTIASGKSIAQNDLNILSNGTLTAGWSQLAIHNAISNEGNLIITDNGAGAFDKNIAGTGIATVDIGNDKTMSYDMGGGAPVSISNAIKLASGTLAARNGASYDIDLSTSGGLIAAGGTLDVKDGGVGSINLGAVDLTNSNLNIAMDTDITAGTSDVLAATSVSGSKKINVSDLNLITSGTTFNINVADASTKDYVDMSNTAISGAATSLMFTYDSTTGNIKSGDTPITTLAEAIASNVDTKMFTMAADQQINPSHVAGGQVLNGTSLSVTGNTNTISATTAGDDGISVGSGKTLSITSATINNFGTAVNNAGTLNLKDVSMTGNAKDVVNTGTTNTSGTTTMDKFDNSGLLNVTDGNTKIAELNNKSGATVQGNGILVLNGESNNAGAIDAPLSVAAGGDLTNAEGGSISGAVGIEAAGKLTNDGTVSGDVVNEGNLVNNSVISGDVDNDTATATAVNNGTISGDVQNSGIFTNSAGATIAGAIEALAGSTTDNSGTITGDVANAGTMTNSGNGMISGDVANTGTLTNSGDATITGDINNAGGTLDVAGGSIEGDISGAGGTVNVTGDALVSGAMTNQALNVASTGTLETNESTLNGTGNVVTLANGSTLDIANGSTAAVTNAINIAAGDTANTEIDVNVLNGTSDSFNPANINGQVQLTDVEISNLNKIVNNNTDINLAATTGLGDKLIVSDALQGQKFQAMTPIRIMEATISQNGMMNIHPSSDHNDWSSYNPAVLASPVAAQLGGYLVQLNSYDQAFRNMDMYMLMTRKERQALKFRNKMASMQNVSYDPTNQVTDSAAGWVRPYASFENVALHNGPKVSNVMYGTFIGGESELKDLGHGWDGMWGAYVGYNGSHQAYSGVGIYQNGGSLGLVGMAYKDNFFVGGTINTGAGVADASTMYGSETMTMLMAGIAAKTGYNWELADGKFIIQPSLLAAYSFVNTFDYTNAAGVRMDSDPLHAITIEPGLKFIGNLKNGWQPYIGASVVINIMDRTRFMANDISLPNLGVNPYAKYGLGVRKTWGDRFSGFLQAFFTSGGRDGVGFQGGFRWNIGKAGSGHISRDTQTPQLKQTKISLNNKKAAK